MKFKMLILALLLTVFAIPVMAQNSTTDTVSFNGFTFSYDSSLGENVSIVQHAGDSPDVDQPGGPAVKNTEFILYTGDTVPADYDAGAFIQVYKIADFKGYELASNQVTQLQDMLSKKPDLSASMTVDADNSSSNALPYLPVFPAAQVIRGRAQYVGNNSVKGISYVTIYRQDVSPFTSDEFFYTFQGISADENNYISATFRVNASMFPAEIPSDFDYDAFNQKFTDYLNQSVKQINDAKPTDFSPSLDTLDSLIQSMSFSS